MQAASGTEYQPMGLIQVRSQEDGSHLTAEAARKKAVRSNAAKFAHLRTQNRRMNQLEVQFYHPESDNVTANAQTIRKSQSSRPPRTKTKRKPAPRQRDISSPSTARQGHDTEPTSSIPGCHLDPLVSYGRTISTVEKFLIDHCTCCPSSSRVVYQT